MASAGRILIIPKGDYSDQTTYTNLDLVFYNNTSWLCRKECKGVKPSSATSEYWFRFSAIALANNLTTNADGYALDAKQGVVIKTNLEKLIPARLGDVDSTPFNLLTTKPVIYVCNVDEASAATGNKYSDMVREKFGATNDVLVISSKIEMEISQIVDPDERKMFLDDLGLTESGLDQVIKTGYKTLGLQTYYTIGPKEAHAWTITTGMTAPQGKTGTAPVSPCDEKKDVLQLHVHICT